VKDFFKKIEMLPIAIEIPNMSLYPTSQTFHAQTMEIYENGIRQWLVRHPFIQDIMLYKNPMENEIEIEALVTIGNISHFELIKIRKK
jgi:hypothetical protein